MIEKGGALDMIYTDFSKAFDSVAHARLLHKSESIGIKSDLLNWNKISFKWKDSMCKRRWNIIEMEGSDQRRSPEFRIRSVTFCHFHK